MAGMSAGLAVLMMKVIVFLAIVAGVMSLVTVAGLSAPRYLQKMTNNGGRQARCSGCITGFFRRTPSAEMLPVYTLILSITIAMGGRHLGLWKFDLVENPKGWVKDL